MVAFRVWKYVLIFVTLCIFVPIADGSKNKHRVVHRHGHHHRHHKHPKVRLSSIKKSSSEEYTRKINVTNTMRPWRLNKTSTFGLFKDSYSDDGRVSTLGNVATIKSMANINLENSTDTSKIAIFPINSFITDSLNVEEYWQTAQQRTSSEITEIKREVGRNVVNSSMSPRNTEKIKSVANDNSSIHFPNNLQKLFGPTKDEKNLTNALIETPFVQLIRRKRSTLRLNEATNGKSRVPTLLDFSGPAIANDSDEAIDLESIRTRVKRDGSESDKVPSALSSQDSNYLQDLEESFAPSALEIEALKSEDSEKYQRKFQRSQTGFDSMNIPRSKRNVQNNNNDVYKKDDVSKESEPANSIFEKDVVSVNNIDGAEHIRDFSSLNPYTSDRPYEIVAFKSAQQTVDNETALETIESDYQQFHAENSIKKGDGPVTDYRNAANFDLSEKKTITKPEMEKINDNPHVVSASTEFSLKDDNSLLRNRLDDVYPEIVEDAEHPSPVVMQLARTKRFSDGFVGLEAADPSYANEADNSRTVDEPYAEDNRIIDSMLSKVDYRSAVEQSRLAPSDNEAELYSPKASIRNKRGTLSKRLRRRGSKKRKKNHKGRAKKPHRSKMKREFEDVPERMISESRKNGEFNGENFDDRNILGVDQIVSPHDGRRRRESEAEQNDYFYLRQNDAADGDRRDVRHSGDNRDGIEADNNNQVSRYIASRSAVNEENQTREKRDNSLQELKYFQNVRETDGVQNRSEDVADKIRPIEEIEHLAEQLLAKVKELRGYVNEGCVNGAMQDSQVSSSTIDRPTDSSPKPVAADVAKRPESCWKHSATWNRQSESSKPNAKSGRNLRAQRCSKKIRRKRTSHRKWDRWTDWSSCSVTCGRGRQIRWRHCIRNCSTAETEMEEKACQLPACAPGKFLGIFG